MLSARFLLQKAQLPSSGGQKGKNETNQCCFSAEPSNCVDHEWSIFPLLDLRAVLSGDVRRRKRPDGRRDRVTMCLSPA